MKKRRLVIRLIVSPFVFGVLLITYTWGLFSHFIKFIRWGGEWKTYQKDDPIRMEEIYKYLKQHTPVTPPEIKP